MLVLGHRGSVTPGPENSTAAIAGAVAAGADGVETDLRRTSDGQLVLCHEPAHPDRPEVEFFRHPYDPAGPAPLATAVMAAVPDGLFVLEIKNIPGQPDFDAPTEATAQLLVPLLRDGLADHPGGVVVSAFDWYAIEYVRDALDGAVRTAFLLPAGVALDAGLAYAGPARHHELHVPVATLLEGPAEAITAAQDAGLAVIAWTVTEDDQALRLRDLGVDGVMVDDPVSVLAALR